jgi:lipoyl(octanoyl) transferase
MAAADAAPELLVVRLGVVEYRAALALQEAVRERRIAGELPDVLLLVEHPPVYTRGRRSQDGDLPFEPEWYAEQGIDVVPVRRGGQLTYHGPGQLVGYPIMRIADVIAYLRAMEGSLIAALDD